ncbi:molybdopterin-binding protein [Asticcacaulis sp. BYS171W]|uniref:Molybdenum cofactor biosynthesis protein B n=1 Tax=Asticcacaulis aquaticus TaxID=2984212 RepID=A0ABT5HWI3_9CAUL|nr:molybdopterin-binding protein [Asticcacaulis aquaticus]MDC7684451.1 molybdopterin-binding protein [Asticcacaulis aquaticus]
MNISENPLGALVRVARPGRTDKAAEDYLGARLADVGYGQVLIETVHEDITAIRDAVTRLIAKRVQVIVTLGGTGPGLFDVTPEAIEPLLEKRFDGFSVLFHMYSHQTAGLPGMLSRTFAGTIGSTAVFGLPGSIGAVTDAWENILAFHLAPDTDQCTLRRVISPGRKPVQD